MRLKSCSSSSSKSQHELFLTDLLILPPIDAPGQPGKPEVIDADKDHITMAWKKPKKDGGAPIKGYNLERRDSKSDRWVRCNSVPIEVIF